MKPGYKKHYIFKWFGFTLQRAMDGFWTYKSKKYKKIDFTYYRIPNSEALFAAFFIYDIAVSVIYDPKQFKT